KQNKERWEIGLQAAVSKNGKRRGWSVSEHNGRTRLRLQFPKAGEWPANAQTNLPYAWDADSVDDIVLLINRIYAPVMGGEVTLKAAITDVLATSYKKADLVVSPWPDIVQTFRDYKLNFGNRIAPKTFEASYERYLSVACCTYKAGKQLEQARELMERVLSHQRVNQKPGVKHGEELKRWIDMPKSRLECCLALKKFLEYAVAEHRQPKAFLVSDRDYLEVRGADGKSRKKAVLTDAEVLELIRLLPESWANVVKITRLFGVRPWEIEHIARATNDDGNHQLRVIKGKTFTTRSGVKEETEPRWLEPVAVNGTTFDLVQNWDQLPLPQTVSGKTLGNILRRLPYWQQLVAEYEARGEWLRPYSFRDTFSVRAHGCGIEDKMIAAALGHSIEVHHRSYRTSEWRSVRSAFAGAS
ncbi:MAG: hypothetical protein ED554_00005, partial [Synechococcus sp. YX04-3]